MTNISNLESEISEIKSLLDDLESVVMAESYNPEKIMEKILALTTPEELMARYNAKDMEWLKNHGVKQLNITLIDKMDIMSRLSQLRVKYPNESRIKELGRKGIILFRKIFDVNTIVMLMQKQPDPKEQLDTFMRAWNSEFNDN